MTKTLWLAVALLAVGTPGLRAQEAVNRTLPAAADGSVQVHNVAGRVRVIAWDRAEVRVTGTLGAGTERLETEGDGRSTRIHVVVERGARNVRGSELEVRVPQRSAVGVHTTSADVEVHGVAGAVEVGSTSGDIRVDGRPAAVSASSTSGDVRLQVATARVRAVTTSGEVHVAGSASESIQAQSVSGGVVVSAGTAELVAKAVSGDLSLSGVSRRVVASTVSGGAAIRTGKMQYGAFESVSGDLLFEGDLQAGGAFSVQSHSGSVTLALPDGLAAAFEVNTFSGDIRSDFGGEPRRLSRYAPGRELRFRSGDGGPLVSVKTFSGDVRLLKR